MRLFIYTMFCSVGFSKVHKLQNCMCWRARLPQNWLRAALTAAFCLLQRCQESKRPLTFASALILTAAIIDVRANSLPEAPSYAKCERCVQAVKHWRRTRRRPAGGQQRIYSCWLNVASAPVAKANLPCLFIQESSSAEILLLLVSDCLLLGVVLLLD